MPRDNTGGRISRRYFLQTITLSTVPLLSGCANLGSVGHPPIDEIKKQSTTPEYEKLYRNINDYEGEYVHYTGRITDIAPDTEATEFLVSLPSSSFTESHILYCHWDGNPYREDDEVVFWGEVEGLTEYQSLGGDKQVPEIDILEIQLA